MMDRICLASGPRQEREEYVEEDAEADELDWAVRLLPCSGTILAQGEVFCVKCNRNAGEGKQFMRHNHTCGAARNAVKYKRI